MKYFITNTSTDKWETTNAKTLRGAKTLATKSIIYLSDTVKVGVDNGGDIVPISEKRQHGQWIDAI